MTPKDFEYLCCSISTLDDTVGEVWSVERANKNFWIFEMQLFGNIFSNLRCCSGGVGMETRLREAISQRRELTVLGTEVMAPLADAMRFIDRESLNLKM